MRKLAFSLIAMAAALGIQSASADDLVIATAGPITGDLAEFGAQMQRGAERRVDAQARFPTWTTAFNARARRRERAPSSRADRRGRAA